MDGANAEKRSGAASVGILQCERQSAGGPGKALLRTKRGRGSPRTVRRKDSLKQKHFKGMHLAIGVKKKKQEYFILYFERKHLTSNEKSALHVKGRTHLQLNYSHRKASACVCVCVCDLYI